MKRASSSPYKHPPSTIPNAWAPLKLPPPSSLPWVTRGIEVTEGRYGRLLHTAVPAAWKWSYASCQRCFVSACWLHPLLPSVFQKSLHWCSLAKPREGINGGDWVDKAHPAEVHTEEEVSDWLIRHSLLASLFTCWDPWHSTQPPLPFRNPQPLQISPSSTFPISGEKKGGGRWVRLGWCLLPASSPPPAITLRHQGLFTSLFFQQVCLFMNVAYLWHSCSKSAQPTFFWKKACFLLLWLPPCHILGLPCLCCTHLSGCSYFRTKENECCVKMILHSVCWLNSHF